MCGICGVWEYGAGEGSIDSSLLTRMRDEMTHRGPDDAGELIFDEHRGGTGMDAEFVLNGEFALRHRHGVVGTGGA